MAVRKGEVAEVVEPSDLGLDLGWVCVSPFSATGGVRMSYRRGRGLIC